MQFLYSFWSRLLYVVTAFWGFSQVAWGQTQQAQQPSTMELIVIPMGFLLIVYFFMIRPQQKKAKEHQNLLSNLKPGDEVITSGGLVGRVKSVADQFVSVEVSSGVVIKVLKPHIGGLTQKAPAQAAPAKA